MKRIITLVNAYCVLILLCSFLFCFPGLLAAAQEEAVLAGGCFWCLEHDLENLHGVYSVESGYTGGDLSNPTYKNHKGHQEAVIVYFDPTEISYKKILRAYWRNVDPLDGGGQFCDQGEAYQPVIFTSGVNQQNEAIQSKDDAAKELGKPITNLKIKILDANKFWLAEDYHQNFAERNNLKYNFYRYSCGRDARLDELWGERSKTADEWNHDPAKHNEKIKE